MKKFLLLFILIIAFGKIKADDISDSTSIENNILFFKDPRIDVLIKMYSREKVEKKVLKTSKIQLMQANQREKVFEAKNQFMAKFPGIPSFVTYQSPNFKLRVGEFQSSEEAFKFLKQVKASFPASFVIDETVAEPKTANKKTK